LHFATGAMTHPRPRALAWFSFVAALSLMTRLDSAILLAAPAWSLASSFRRAPAPGGAGFATSRTVLGCAFVLPGLVPLAAWFAWKWSYYHDVLPLTFHAKQGGAAGPTIAQGIRYLADYGRSYWFLPLVLVLFLTARFAWRDAPGRWCLAGSV